MYVDALYPDEAYDGNELTIACITHFTHKKSILASIQGRHSLFMDPAEAGLGKLPETRDKSYDFTPNQTILTHMTKSLLGTPLD